MRGPNMYSLYDFLSGKVNCSLIIWPMEQASLLKRFLNLALVIRFALMKKSWLIPWNTMIVWNPLMISTHVPISFIVSKMCFTIILSHSSFHNENRSMWCHVLHKFQNKNLTLWSIAYCLLQEQNASFRLCSENTSFYTKKNNHPTALHHVQL